MSSFEVHSGWMPKDSGIGFSAQLDPGERSRGLGGDELAPNCPVLFSQGPERQLTVPIAFVDKRQKAFWTTGLRRGSRSRLGWGGGACFRGVGRNECVSGASRGGGATSPPTTGSGGVVGQVSEESTGNDDLMAPLEEPSLPL